MTKITKNDSSQSIQTVVNDAVNSVIFTNIEMPNHVFFKFTDVVYKESGIKLDAEKKNMLISRLSRRLKILGIDNYSDYYDFIHEDDEEIYHMIDVVTTNKTDFFREQHHFHFLEEKVLPEIFNPLNNPGDKKINIWSAGCSTGEEPYSIGMVCMEHFKHLHNQFEILATDISGKVLEAADKAVYSDKLLAPVSDYFVKKYFMKGDGEMAGFHKIVPELRKQIKFERHNIVYDSYSDIPDMDIIFCRNMIIYFDRPVQIRIYNEIIDKLKIGGYLMIGHSETLYGVMKRIKNIAPTIYQKIG